MNDNTDDVDTPETVAAVVHIVCPGAVWEEVAQLWEEVTRRLTLSERAFVTIATSPIEYGMKPAMACALSAIGGGMGAEQAVQGAAAVHVVCPAELWARITSEQKEGDQ